MKDYVIKINDVTPWRIALRAEADAASSYAFVNQADEVKLALPMTGVVAQVGSSTVSICRLRQEEHDWLIGLASVQEIGFGDPFIKEISDITWINGGKGLYHSIHLQTTSEVDDGDGGTITITPPELHGVIYS